MSRVPLEIYLDNMNEIKQRFVIIANIWNRDLVKPKSIFEIESIALQIRKILELIALGNLVLNKDKYCAIHKKFSAQWNAKYILQDIERINPSFYPKPVDEIPKQEKNGGVVRDLQDKKSGFLTKDEFIELYDMLGGILHAKNPFAGKDNVREFEKNIIEVLNKIQCLLQVHVIKIYEDELYIIHMYEKGVKSAKGYVFEQVKK